MLGPSRLAPEYEQAHGPHDDRKHSPASSDGEAEENGLHKQPCVGTAILQREREECVREAGKDDVLPLSHPIETADGNIISEIPVAAGQEILISICAYNR